VTEGATVAAMVAVMMVAPMYWPSWVAWIHALFDVNAHSVFVVV